MPARPRVRDGYVPLYTYLEHRYASTVALTFEQIESLLGFALPAAATGARMVDQRGQRLRGLDRGETDGMAQSTGPTRDVRAAAVTLRGGMLLAVCVLAVLFLTSWRRRTHLAELGTVSTQWLAKHREYDRNYPYR